MKTNCVGNKTMNLYYRFKNRFAVYLEFQKDYGAQTWIKINTCNRETILDIPYGQVILTTASKLEGEHAQRNYQNKRSANMP